MLEIEKTNSEYERCNLCLSKENLYIVRNPKRSFILTICEECCKQINNKITWKNNLK